MGGTPGQANALQDPRMTDIFSNAQSAADYTRTATDLKPHIGIVLGSGLGNFANHVRGATRIPYAEIPHFPRSTVEGHSGHLVLGTIAGVPVAVMQGRVHAYEGYPLSEVAFPTLVAALVSMSTVHETIVARHMCLEVLGIALVTNLAAGVVAAGQETAEAIHHEDVMEVGRRAEKQFTSLLTALIPQIAALTH